MNNQLTNIIFILDRSGSMSGREADSIGGFNSMLEKQKRAPGEAILSTVLFNQDMKYLHKNIPIDNAENLTVEDYFPAGSTALLDAIGNTITDTEIFYKTLNIDEKPQKTIIVIITDGYENASKEYSLNQIKRMIDQKQESGEWEFIFLGANIDAIRTANSYGIKLSHAANFHNDSRGIQTNFGAISDAVACFRSGGQIDESWKEEIVQDFESRKDDQ